MLATSIAAVHTSLTAKQKRVKCIGILFRGPTERSADRGKCFDVKVVTQAQPVGLFLTLEMGDNSFLQNVTFSKPHDVV
jgi:hypothetical protein